MIGAAIKAAAETAASSVRSFHTPILGGVADKVKPRTRACSGHYLPKRGKETFHLRFATNGKPEMIRHRPE